MKNIQLLLLIISLIPIHSKAQTADKYTGKMLSLTEEKAYLSFDKPYYTAGEMLFFKAFVANATSHAIDSFPTVLYIDFMELNTKRIIMQQKLKIEHGTTFGSFNRLSIGVQLFTPTQQVRQVFRFIQQTIRKRQGYW